MAYQKIATSSPGGGGRSNIYNPWWWWKELHLPLVEADEIITTPGGGGRDFIYPWWWRTDLYLTLVVAQETVLFTCASIRNLERYPPEVVVPQPEIVAAIFSCSLPVYF